MISSQEIELILRYEAPIFFFFIQQGQQGDIGPIGARGEEGAQVRTRERGGEVELVKE